MNCNRIGEFLEVESAESANKGRSRPAWARVMGLGGGKKGIICSDQPCWNGLGDGG